MTRKHIIVGGVAALAIVGALGIASLVLFRGDAPEAVNLDTALAAVATGTQGPAATPAAGIAASTDGMTDGDLTGTWTLVADGESFLGYRVQEELVGIGGTTAVGRTAVVSGSLEFDGEAIVDVRIEADVSALTSDDSRRDGALQRQALESSRYPTATFALTEPIAIEAVPATGETIEATATGDLTLHGVTRTVSIPLQGQLAGEHVVVVGSTVLAFADFDIEQPSAMSVLSVDDEATLELQLIFARA